MPWISSPTSNKYCGQSQWRASYTHYFHYHFASFMLSTGKKNYDRWALISDNLMFPHWKICPRHLVSIVKKISCSLWTLVVTDMSGRTMQVQRWTLSHMIISPPYSSYSNGEIVKIIMKCNSMSCIDVRDEWLFATTVGNTNSCVRPWKFSYTERISLDRKCRKVSASC